MQTRYTDAIPLAARPDLQQYRRIAKDLAKAAASHDAKSIQRWASDWIRRLAVLLAEQPNPEYTKEKQIVGEVEALVKEYDTSPLAAGATLANAQLFLSRVHGFESWPRFSAHIAALDDRTSPISRFELAADAVVDGDVATLNLLIAESPDLVRERASRDHRATLLHYIAANGHEGFRQRTPKNAVEVARVLLAVGAEPDALAKMYGHLVTPMQILVSSTHPHDAGVQEALVDCLVDYGANPSGVGNDGSPLMTAFRFHYPRAAETLAKRGATIDTVVAAAALGRVDLVDQMVDDHGQLTYEPGPIKPWPTLSADPAQHLGFALAWATAFGRDDVVNMLLRKGVDPSGKDDDMSALHYAAARGRMHLVRLLVSAGASLETLNSDDGTVLSGMMWFAYESPVKGVDYAEVARELIALGARTDSYPDMKDDLEPILKGRVPNRTASRPGLPSSP